MKYLRYPLLLLVLVSVGCDDDPNDPSDTPITFAAALTTGAEVPPIADPTEAGASGSVTIQLHVTRDSSNAITAATVDFQFSLSGFPPGSNITAAHIHEAPVGQSAGFIINVGLAAGEVQLSSGAAAFTRNGVQVPDPAIAQRMIDNPAGFYFNVHSSRNPAGVVRGQLARTN